MLGVADGLDVGVNVGDTLGLAVLGVADGLDVGLDVGVDVGDTL